MKESLTTNNSRDFRQRYEGTYGFYTSKSGKRLLVYVTSVNERVAGFRDAEGNEYFCYANSGEEFEFIPVNRGYYNGVKTTYFLSRVPARQWQRGISPSNTQISCLSKYGFAHQELDFVSLREAMINTIPLKPAYENFGAGKRESVALSKHFALGMGRLWFYNDCVGTVTDNKIKLNTSVVEQEVRDLIKRNTLGFSVEVVHE